ncbi:hypothetical protein ACFYQ5_00195 [Streptomyces sp. NPDC005794]|uniref:hypothetical protein n=1 Tax=Streptomyces sp. NPDC005794 TaxID=3364733 RepID=UPI0036B3FE4C
MIGLFWIEQDTVCLGAPPADDAPGVFLSPSGLSMVGPTQLAWSWADVMDVQVLDVPVRSAAARWAARATTFAAAALNAWGPDSPSELTVVVHTPGQRVETPASAAANAYTQREVDLSHGLLSHFVRGSASPTTLTRWWAENRPVEVLRSRQREDILEDWLAPLL